jgi:hypothetical protein
MKTNFVCAAFVCAVLTLSTSTAFATVTPIIATPVILEHDPAGIVATGTTDGDGNVTFRGLAPGKYVLIIDGPGFVAAMDRLAPPSEKKSGGLSVGIGGGFFGGSSHSSSSHQGAGPAQGASHSGGSTTTSGDSGVSVNLNQMVARDNASGSGNGAPMITFTATVTPSSPSTTPTGTVSFMSETPYCRDVAGQGMRIGFTVPGSGTSEVKLSLTTASVGAATSGIHIQN